MDLLPFFLLPAVEDYPAHFAAHEGNLKLLKVLIQEGHCTVDDRDAMGATPAHQGRYEVVSS